MTASLTATELFGLFLHFCVLSLLAVGGAITTAPDMHRSLVDEHRWLTDEQFTASIAIAQAAPGPNVLFIAVLGWNVAGAAGVLATMTGILLPSTLLTLSATRWAETRRETRGVRAFTAGMTPLTLGLLLSTGWLLAEPSHGRWGAIALVVGSAVVMTRWRLSPLWAVAAGAVVGALGFA